MARLRRDMTMEQQLAQGPMDLPFLMLVVLLTGIGVITVFSASYATAASQGRGATYFFLRQAVFAVLGIVGMYHFPNQLPAFPLDECVRAAGRFRLPPSGVDSAGVWLGYCGRPAVAADPHCGQRTALRGGEAGGHPLLLCPDEQAKQ